jgi:hypothetical protein
VFQVIHHEQDVFFFEIIEKLRISLRQTRWHESNSIGDDGIEFPAFFEGGDQAFSQNAG